MRTASRLTCKHMKTSACSFVLILLSIFLPTAHSADGSSQADAKKASFGLYLFADAVSWQDAREDWKSRALSMPPLISEADILSYDFSQHTMTITADAFSRYTNATFRKLVVPFVLVANGERFYLGSFVSLFCSASIPMPSITNGHIMAEDKKNKLTIDRNYAAPIDPAETDPRADARIKRALNDLGKLR